MRHIRTRDIKARAEELLEQYPDAMEEKFNEEFRHNFKDYFFGKGIEETITIEEIQEFLDNYDEPDEDSWAYDQVNSEIDDMADAYYQMKKDEGI